MMKLRKESIADSVIEKILRLRAGEDPIQEPEIDTVGDSGFHFSSPEGQAYIQAEFEAQQPIELESLPLGQEQLEMEQGQPEASGMGLDESGIDVSNIIAGQSPFESILS